MEAARDELENKIAYENFTSKKIEEDALRFWLMRFRKLDVKRKEHRQIKLEVTFNFKEDTVQASVEKEQTGSDMKSNAAPTALQQSLKGFCFPFSSPIPY